MSVERSFRDKLNLSKRIPLHYQKRYLANISNGSFNATLITGVYKNKIKNLLKNNKILAVALQNDRAKKEELMEESKTNASLIMFSRLKLASMSENLKKVVSVLDETLTLLQMYSSASCNKFIPKNTASREEFKEHVKEVLMDSIPEESPERKESEPIQVSKDTDEKTKVTGKNHPETFIKKSSKIRKSHIQKRNCQKARPVVFNASTELLLTPTQQIHNNQIKDKNGECLEPVFPAVVNNNYKLSEENCSLRNGVSQIEGLTKNKTVSSEATKNKGPLSGIPTLSKRGRKIKVSEITNNNSEKGKISFGVNVKNKKKSSSLNFFGRRKLQEDAQELEEIQSPETECNSNNETLVLHDLAQQTTSKIVPDRLPIKNVNDTYIISTCDKENIEAFQTPLRSKRKLKSQQIEPEVKIKRSMRIKNTPLKTLSSEINIKHLEMNGMESKSKVESDDLTSLGTKYGCICDENEVCHCLSTHSKFVHRVPNTVSNKWLRKSLGENTCFLTSEAHSNPTSVMPNAHQINRTENINLVPRVLVQDILKSSKTICKNILDNLSDEVRTEKLDLEPLNNCSILNVIPEESIPSFDSDHSINKHSRKGTKVTEPASSIVEEFAEEPLHEKRKVNSKHASSACYKEGVTDPALSDVEKLEEEQLHERKRSNRKRAPLVSYKEPFLNLKLRR